MPEPTRPPQRCGSPSFRRRPCSTTPLPLSVRAILLSLPVVRAVVTVAPMEFDSFSRECGSLIGAACEVFACLSRQN